MNYLTRRLTYVAILLGASMLASPLMAQRVTIRVSTMICSRETDGEPGSDDEVYFTLAGATNRGAVTVPKIGSTTDDHWDIQPGRPVNGFQIYEGFVAPGDAGILTYLIRESDNSFLTKIAGILTSSVRSLLTPFTDPLSLAGLSPAYGLVQNISNALSGDGDQTIGSFGLVIKNVNGQLNLQTVDGVTSSTTPLGNGWFRTFAWGSGSTYQVDWYVELDRTGARMFQKRSGFCLDLPGGNPADGVQVQQFPCNDGANQRWIFINDNMTGAGLTGIIINEQSGKCLDVRDASTAAGGVVQQFTCHGRPNQKWQYNILPAQSGYGQIINQGSHICLDVPNASFSVTGLQQYPCGYPYQKNQMWLF